MADLTKHSVKRIRQRLGLNKSAAERELERALNGLQPKDFAGSLKRYLDKLSIQGGRRFRITPVGIFVFSAPDDALVTVLPVPQKYRSTVMTVWKASTE